MQVDYIIVGLGLAGLAFAKELENHHKNFVVFEDSSQNSSKVAGGVYNPVVLKRFTPVWNASEQLKLALPFYRDLEKQFEKKYIHTFDTCRVFKSVEEQNNWFAACDKPILSEYMVPEVVNESYNGVIADHGFGKIEKTGRVDVKQLLVDYTAHLKTNGKIIFESFDHDALELLNDGVLYKGFEAKTVVFCEGFGVKKNPYFNHLPLNEAKGELLTIHAPELDVDFLIKAAVFVLPLGNHYYKVGATFNWKDKTSIPSEEGREELKSKLETFITVPYKIVEQSAGIRPTVKDRRPLVGKHPAHPQLTVLNGLGTRGVMIAPSVAKALYNYIENGQALDREVSIERFD